MTNSGGNQRVTWREHAKNALITGLSLPNLLGPGSAGLVPDASAPEAVVPVGIERQCVIADSPDSRLYTQSDLDGQIQSEQDRERDQAENVAQGPAVDSGPFAPPRQQTVASRAVGPSNDAPVRER